MPRGANRGREQCLDRMESALTIAGYSVERRSPIGKLFGLKDQHVHLRAIDHDGLRCYVMLIGQINSGSTEEKIPFKVISLVNLAQRSLQSDRFYLVLYGRELGLYDFYVDGGLQEYVAGCDQVNIVRIDRFVELASHRRL